MQAETSHLCQEWWLEVWRETDLCWQYMGVFLPEKILSNHKGKNQWFYSRKTWQTPISRLTSSDMERELDYYGTLPRMHGLSLVTSKRLQTQLGFEVQNGRRARRWDGPRLRKHSRSKETNKTWQVSPKCTPGEILYHAGKCPDFHMVPTRCLAVTGNDTISVYVTHRQTGKVRGSGWWRILCTVHGTFL